MLTEPLTESTLVPIGMAITVGLAVVASFVKLTLKLNNIERDIHEIKAASKETWSLTKMEVFCARLGSRNPTLHVPDPRRIGHQIRDVENERAGD